MAVDEILLDDLPDYIQASMELRARWVDSVTNGGYEFVASDLTAWPLARPVRVAFRGGTDQLRKDIEDATSVITAACGLMLEFRKADGSFHEWSPTDQEHAGEIRVGFELPGFFSLVGQDSVSPETGPPDQPVGGRPGQCSLNLGRFTTDRPTKWKGVVRHEFLHALGFRHEHQNMRGPCEGEFRWEDDPGYTPTTGPNGSFIEDAAGKRPGIYTYLAGPPNRWSRAKVEHNLRTTEDAAAIASSFDPASVMLYRFPALFYRTSPCSCAPTGDGEDLSEGDKRGLRLLYPRVDDRAVDAIAARRDGFDELARERRAGGCGQRARGGAVRFRGPVHRADAQDAARDARRLSCLHACSRNPSPGGHAAGARTFWRSVSDSPRADINAR